MSSLLLQSCSATKVKSETRMPALSLYDGYFYKIIKKAKREEVIRSDLDLCILSAKYGIVQPTEPIEPYDWRMDETRAAELEDEVDLTLREIVRDAGYSRVVLNMGQEYRLALGRFVDKSDVEVRSITGAGIGHKGRALKQFLRGDDSVVEVVT